MMLNIGVQSRIVSESPTIGGTTVRDFIIQSDAVLVTLFVSSISLAGTIDVEVVGVVDDQESPLFVFPQVSASTTEVLLRRSSIAPSNIRIRVTYTGACTYEVQARAVSAGSSDVRLLGAAGFRVSQSTVGISAVVLIPSSLTDRAGLVIKNWSNTQTVYIAESMANATTGIGYPLAPKDALAVDLSAGAEVWAVSDASGADIRIGESG